MFLAFLVLLLYNNILFILILYENMLGHFP